MSEEIDNGYEQEVMLSTTKEAKKKEEFTSLNVVLGRDLIFMDWTVQFGSQLLGIIVGAILGALFGVNLFSLFTPSKDNTVQVKPYIFYEIGIILCIIALSAYYIARMRIPINAPRAIARNKWRIIKVAFLAFSILFTMAYLYNVHIAPAIYKISGVSPPGQGSSSGDQEPPTVEFSTLNEYIILLAIIALSYGIFTLLYGGILYSLTRIIGAIEGVAILAPAILLTFNIISQSISQNLLKGQWLIFLGDLTYFLVIAITTILVYHLSRRIELSIITLFIGFLFGYQAPTNAFITIIALKWGFPNFSDGINTTADILARTIDILEYIGIAGLFAYLLIFYHDTIAFGKKLWLTLKKQGLNILGFFLTVFVIEIVVQYLYRYLGFIFAFFAFLILLGLVNSFISSRYGRQSYTAIIMSLAQNATLETEPLIPTLNEKVRLLTQKPKKQQQRNLIIGTVLPILIYYLVLYLTVAVTPESGAFTFFFFIAIVPLTIGLMAFSITYFFVKEPLIKPYFSYSLKVVGAVGGLFYYIYVIIALLYNTLGLYPLLVVFFSPLVIIPLKDKKQLGDLLLELPTENKKIALKRLLTDKEIEIEKIAEVFHDSPVFLKFWFTIIVAKRYQRNKAIELIQPMIISSFPLERATGALCLLYLEDDTRLDQLVKDLEQDDDYRVRKAIAYGLRFLKKLPRDTYKRIIDAQYYEENGEVLETLKETISILEERFEVEEEEEEKLEEVEEF